MKIEKQRYHWKRLLNAWLHVLERYLEYRYFTCDLLRADKLTKFVDAFTSSGRIILAVWAQWVLGAWVSNDIFGSDVSLHGPRSCLALGGPFWG